MNHYVRLYPLFILLLVIGVHATVIDGTFVGDDHLLIVNNPAVKVTDNWFYAFQSDYFDRYGEGAPVGYYRPLTRISFILDYHLAGLNPHAFRATNLIIHAMISVLLYLFCLQLELNRALSLFSAAVFSVFPLHVEVLAISTARSDLLCAFFFLLSLYLYELFKARHGMATVFLVVSGLSFFFALLGKEMAMSLPAILFIREFFDKSEHITVKTNIFSSLKPAIGYGIIFFAYFLIRFKVLNVGISSIDRPISFSQLFAAIPVVLYFYLFYLCFPHRILASDWIAIPEHFQWHHFLLWVTVAMLIAVLLIYSWKKNRFAIYFLITIVSLVPVLAGLGHIRNPMSGDYLPVAERFLYIPSIFIVISAAFALHLIPLKKDQLKIIIGFLLVFFLAFRSYQTIPQYKNDAVMFQVWASSLEKIPEKQLRQPMKKVLFWYRAELEMNLGNYEKAIAYYKRAITFAPCDIMLAYNLTIALKKSGHSSDALAVLSDIMSPERISCVPVDQLRRIEIPARELLGNLLWQHSRFGQALEEFQRILKVHPNHLIALQGKGEILLHENRFSQAEGVFKKLVNIYPGYSRAWYHYARLCLMTGRLSKANDYLDKALYLTKTDANKAKMIDQFKALQKTLNHPVSGE